MQAEGFGCVGGGGGSGKFKKVRKMSGRFARISVGVASTVRWVSLTLRSSSTMRGALTDATLPVVTRRT